MTNNKKCPFCDLRDRVLLENKFAIAFLSNPRKIPGHFLVCPKRHIENPNELTVDELNAIFVLIMKVERTLLTDGAQGCDIQQNYRPFIKQGKIKVDHVHFHVLPRSPGDVLSVSSDAEHALFQPLGVDEIERFARLLK